MCGQIGRCAHNQKAKIFFPHLVTKLFRRA
ncbi:hypothetical protein Gorai_014380, partial [Gossypium raimondii]|nr:hypothetical protein [Gossypium raimondii]